MSKRCAELTWVTLCLAQDDIHPSEKVLKVTVLLLHVCTNLYVWCLCLRVKISV
jgi:hypothetical protein